LDLGLEAATRMKTVTAVFKDGVFKPGEFERLQKLIIQKLREILPDVIVRVERNKVAWDPLITRVSGYWEEDSEPVLRQVHPIVLEIWKKGEWRDGFNFIEVKVIPAPPPAVTEEIPSVEVSEVDMEILRNAMRSGGVNRSGNVIAPPQLEEWAKRTLNADSSKTKIVT
jgi:hypothetical protein